MRKLIRIFRSACTHCIGRGYIELSNGHTMECSACKGKGIL